MSESAGGLHADPSSAGRFGRVPPSIVDCVLERAPVIVLLLGTDGRIQYVNPYFEQLTGYGSADVVGCDWFDTLLPPRDRGTVRDLFASRLKSGPVRGHVNPVVTKAGEERSIEWHDEAITDQQGMLTGILALGVDVTERKRLERRLEWVQELGLIGSWEFDLVTGRSWWSEQILDVLGLHGLASPSVEGYLALTHPDDRLEVEAWLARLQDTSETPRALTHRIVTADGVEKYVRAEFRLAPGDDGSVARVEGTLQDVTESETVKARLEEAQDLASLGYWELDPATYVLYWSREIFRIFEVERGLRLSYESFLERVHPDDQQLVDDTYRTSVATRSPYHITHRLRMPDGRTKWVEERGHTVYTADGGAVRSFGTVQDITAACRLHDTEASFAAAFDGNSVAMAIWRVRDDAVIAANDAFSRLVGCERSALVDRPLGALGMHVDGVSLGTVLSGLAVGEPVADLRVTFRREGGDLRDLVLSLSPLRLHAEDRSVLTLVDDTERTRSDVALRAALTEKETLLREVHHRVKNNIQIIAGLVHFQERKASTPEHRSGMAELRQRLLAMSLVHQRLYLSSGLSRVDFGEYARALVAELLWSMSPGPAVRIDVRADSVSLPLELALPCGMLICELVTNMLKYAFPSGREGRGLVEVRAVAEQLELVVEDDGIGLPEEFDPRTSGSFGWELVRVLTRQVGGAVQAVSGGGTRVLLSFPLPAGHEGAGH